MKLVRFATNDMPSRLGVMIDDAVFALGDLLPEAPTDMIGVIDRWEEMKGPLGKRIAERAASPIRGATLLAPIERPGKILAIGLNYADHIAEAKDAGVKIPTEQVWFCKQPTSVNSPFGGIHKPIISDQLDYEVELVVVIGKKGRRISAARAPDYVFGYTVGNDVTVRDWQQKTAQWMLGKSFDTHCPFGPSIVTADEIGDPHVLGVRSFVNGELRQNSNTRHLVFNIWQQIAELSQAMTLEPGDLIFTGTPGGVGFAFKPPRPLVIGDTVRCEVDKIGAIENRVVAEV
jgi:2-keto-4-pentenoate hydratase/2-oxohepta-3-ene-1,7-dioic acid hydratase in catechol pathway